MSQISKFRRRHRRCLSCHRTQLLTRPRAANADILHPDLQVARNTLEEHCHLKQVGAFSIWIVGKRAILVFRHFKTVKSLASLELMDHLAWAQIILQTLHKITKVTKKCHITKSSLKQMLRLFIRWWVVMLLEAKIKICFTQGKVELALVRQVLLFNKTMSRSNFSKETHLALEFITKLFLTMYNKCRLDRLQELASSRRPWRTNSRFRRHLSHSALQNLDQIITTMLSYKTSTHSFSSLLVSSNCMTIDNDWVAPIVAVVVSTTLETNRRLRSWIRLELAQRTFLNFTTLKESL